MVKKKKYDLNWDGVDRIKGGYIKHFLLYPPLWTQPNNSINMLLNWEKYKFKHSNVSNIANQKGIYCFVVQPRVRKFFQTRYLFYIGQTKRTLRVRYEEYLKEYDGTRKSRKKVKEMLDKYGLDYLYFYFTPITQITMIDEVEQKLIDTFIPFVNVKINKAKINPEFQYIYE